MRSRASLQALSPHFKVHGDRLEPVTCDRGASPATLRKGPTYTAVSSKTEVRVTEMTLMPSCLPQDCDVVAAAVTALWMPG
jgi:hypothetical protein